MLMEHLEKLTNLHGVSGDEGRIRAYIRKEAEKIVPKEDIEMDAMGNLYVHKRGPGKRVMVAAHMDEVGMIVKGIREDGLLAYEPNGLDPRVCVSKRVVVGKKQIPGVIGAKAIHLQSPEEFKKAIRHSNLYVDIGAKDKKDAEESVRVGDYISFDSRYEILGDSISAKALDDRVGCAMLLELMKKDFPADISYAFTVQEEVGLRGSLAAVQRIRPDFALVLEGTTANDLPREMNYVTKMGDGAAISFMDGRTVVKKNVFEVMKALAVEENIHWQCRCGTSGGTDAGNIHKALAGCLVGGISVPCRYIHSPISLCSISDVRNVYRLAEVMLQKGVSMLFSQED